MIIDVICPHCDWQGRAEVGRRTGLRLSDQECPNCHSEIKRSPRRHNSVGWAELKQYIYQRDSH